MITGTTVLWNIDTNVLKAPTKKPPTAVAISTILALNSANFVLIIPINGINFPLIAWLRFSNTGAKAFLTYSTNGENIALIPANIFVPKLLTAVDTPCQKETKTSFPLTNIPLTVFITAWIF